MSLNERERRIQKAIDQYLQNNKGKSKKKCKRRKAKDYKGIQGYSSLHRPTRIHRNGIAVRKKVKFFKTG